MKIDKLKMGKVYYISIGNRKRNYTYGELIEILSKSSVLIKKKDGTVFRCNVNRLHTTPDKAIDGRKAKQRVLQEQKELQIKEQKTTVDKSIQDQVVKLGKNVYVFKDENGSYVINGFNELIKFNTIEELKQWLERQLLIVDELRKKLAQCKYLRVVLSDGNVKLYSIISISFKKFEIRIRKFEYTGDAGKEKILEKNEISWRFKIIQK